MESGELELRKVFEEVTTKNVKTVVDYSTDTRKIVRDLQTKVDSQDKQIVLLNKLINDLRSQLAVIQAEVYKGGTE
jgi:chaperonin cofactor prefoldin